METEWRPSGPAGAAGGPRSKISIRDLQMCLRFNTPAGGGGLTRYAIAADPTRDLSSIEECGGELQSLGGSWKACLRGV